MAYGITIKMLFKRSLANYTQRNSSWYFHAPVKPIKNEYASNTNTSPHLFGSFREYVICFVLFVSVQNFTAQNRKT